MVKKRNECILEEFGHLRMVQSRTLISEVGLCESSFVQLEYSVEYPIEYSSTGQGKYVSKSIYIRCQKARVTRCHVRHTANIWVPDGMAGTVPELICIVPSMAGKAKFVL